MIYKQPINNYQSDMENRFIKYRPVFKGSYKEFEKIGPIPSLELIEKYKENMKDKLNRQFYSNEVYNSTRKSQDFCKLSFIDINLNSSKSKKASAKM